MVDIDASRIKLNRRQLLAGLSAAFALNLAHDYASDELYLSRFRGVQKAADEIIAAIEQKLKVLPENKTLYVPVGENHSRPSHRLVQQAVLQGLKERGHKIAFGFEADYDFLAEVKIPFLPEIEKARLLAQDPDGENLLKMISSTEGMFLNAQASLQNLFRFCLEEGISTSFNDLATVKGLWDSNPLDPRDPKTVFFNNLLSQNPFASFDALEPMGMALRNAAIVFNSLRHAGAEGARIYIQHCGAAHIFGTETTDCPFELSVTNGYAIWEEECLPVLLTRGNLEFSLSAVSYMGRMPTVILDDLDDKEFTYDWLSGEDDTLRQEELAHMRLLMRRTTLKLYESDDPRFQETAAMKALPQTELAASVRGFLNSYGINPESLDFQPR